jgi:hypothetical protein
LADLGKVRKHLDDIKASGANEIRWQPLRKLMIQELGVVELPKKGGSHVIFMHPLLAKYDGGPGHFQVALHKNKILYRKNYLNSTYRVLHKILTYLEIEGRNAGQKP